MDEAVWRGFVHGDFASIFRFLDFDAALTGIDVNYRRFAADFTTALMAAAYHGKEKIACRLLSSGALACLVDTQGRTAADFARLQVGSSGRATVHGGGGG